LDFFCFIGFLCVVCDVEKEKDKKKKK